MVEARLTVFIGYGESASETVAVDLYNFLSRQPREIINPFCASPRTNSIAATTPQYNATINEFLKNCDIAVFVCDKDTPKSKPIKEEINYLYSNGKQNRIISFAASDDCQIGRAHV